MSDTRLHLVPGKSPRQVTPREGACLDLVHLLRNADIAQALGISEETVKTHLKSAYLKIGAEQRAHAAVLWQTRRAA